MSPPLANITPWVTDGRTESLVPSLLSPGLWPNETIGHVSWGNEPVTRQDIAREAKSLGTKALNEWRALKASEIVGGLATVAAEMTADKVLHSVGALPSHQSVSEMGGQPAGPPNLTAPPAKSGYIVALTNQRLVFLDVITCITHQVGSEPIRWYAVHRAIPFGLPLPPSLQLRFSWTRVLWERHLDLHIQDPNLPALLRFNSYGIDRAPERARAIAMALGHDPGS